MSGAVVNVSTRRDGSGVEANHPSPPTGVWIVEAGGRAVPIGTGGVQGAIVERRNAARGPAFQIERLVSDMRRRPSFSGLELVGAADEVADVRLFQVRGLPALEVVVIERQQEFLVERHARKVRYGGVEI